MIEFPPINRPVQLLNKLLGLKTKHSPNALSQLVQPTVEMLPWWALSAESVVRNTGSAIGAAQLGYINFSTMTVPAGSNWLLLEWSLRMISVAGAVIQIQGAYNYGALNLFFAAGQQSFNNAHPSETLLDCLENRYGYVFVPALTSLGVYVSVNGGTAQTVTSHARIIQFEA